MDKNIRKEFLSFVTSMENGQCKRDMWQKFVVTHYSDEQLEKVRIQLVKLDIANQLNKENISKLLQMLERTFE